MSQSINLLTDQELQQRKKTTFIHVSTFISIVILLVTIGVTAYYWLTISNIDKSIASTVDNIQSLRTQIASMSEIEISARNLGAKIDVLKDTLNNRPYYSVMLDDIQTRVPEGVVIDEFSFGTEGMINLSGSGDTYILISDFINNLLKSNLFVSATINSVTLDTNSGKANYFLVINYDVSKLAQPYATN